MHKILFFQPRWPPCKSTTTVFKKRIKVSLSKFAYPVTSGDGKSMWVGEEGLSPAGQGTPAGSEPQWVIWGGMKSLKLKAYEYMQHLVKSDDTLRICQSVEIGNFICQTVSFNYSAWIIIDSWMCGKLSVWALIIWFRAGKFSAAIKNRIHLKCNLAK